MKRTAVIFSPKFYDHNTGKNHPESAARLRAIIAELKHGRLSESRNWQFVEPKKASVKELQLVHDLNYIEYVRTFCRNGGCQMESEGTTVSLESFDTALYAVGAALTAVDLVMREQFENAFALVRPPGHHASRFRPCGFCLFNNVSVAAEYLLTKFRLKRILIVDIDAHHGNGTQEIFYETDKVLYISLHEDPRAFPRSGFIDEVGMGEGAGYTVNIPLPFRTGDHVYLKAINNVVVPIVRQYKPQFILVSAGFDGHYADPVGKLALSADCYKQVYKTIASLASQSCGGKFVSVLEGGYSLRHIGRMAASAIATMSATPYLSFGRAHGCREKTALKGVQMIKQIKKIQKRFWSID